MTTPVIGPAAINAVIPRTNVTYVDPEYNRLSTIRIAGQRLTADVASAIIGATMSFSTSQIGQVTLTLADTGDAALVRSGIFAKGTTIDWGNQHLDLRGIDYSPGPGGPQLTLKARSRAVSVLKGAGHIGRGAWGEQDVARWVRDRCHEAGAYSRVQDGLGKMLFTRQVYDTVESDWDVMQKAATAVGALCYEFEQTIVFMRPSALMKFPGVRQWPISWTSHGVYTDGLSGMPSYTWSLDGEAESLSFEMLGGDADLARPGDVVTYTGSIGEAKGTWMMSQVDLPLTGGQTVKVACIRPTDPAPQPVTTGV